MRLIAVFLAWCLPGFLPGFCAAADITDRIEVSGFARLVGGIINDDGVAFEGYDDSGSFSEQSLFGIQADVEMTDTLQLAAQALAHTDATRESGIEWFYLNYQPTNHWRLKLGRMRTPFVSYSDVIDVGFAYPWISAPTPIYGSYLFSNYEGGSVSYLSSFGETSFSLEGYWGSDESDVQSAGITFPIDVDDLRGAILELQRDNLKLRLAYHKVGSAKTSIPDLELFIDQLIQQGFNDSAASLTVEGPTEAYHVGLRYDNLDYFFESEFLRIKSSVVVAPPQIDSYYATLGKNFAPFQFQLTLGRSSSTRPRPVDEIPLGVSPLFDALAAGYAFAFDSIPTDDIDYASTGLRWDVLSNVALKSELSWIKERSRSRFFESEGEGYSDFDGDTFLFQIGLEWMF